MQFYGLYREVSQTPERHFRVATMRNELCSKAKNQKILLEIYVAKLLKNIEFYSLHSFRTDNWKFITFVTNLKLCHQPLFF